MLDSKGLKQIRLVLQLFEAIFGADHLDDLLDVLTKTVVDLDRLLQLFDHHRSFLLKNLVLLLLSRQLALGDPLGPIKFGLLSGQLHVKSVQLLDLFFLIRALLTERDPSLLGHAHVVHDVLALASLLCKLSVVTGNQGLLTVDLILLLLDCL